MREILFRAKKKNNGEWMEGFPVRIYDYGGLVWEMHPFNTNFECSHSVIPETIGQYTGLTDKNSKKIFEGDIVHVLGNQQVEDWKNVNYTALIAFIDGGFCAIDGTVEEHGFRRYGLCRMDFDLEVIGNIYDNPELLEV